ncbi:glycosyltransferase [Alicyclobacillus fastidiosus]|uniref:Glycosyltransferase n=2 Tax=Alicyclobacillus fastidiosus TaxID=392011 RepID=A0ABY6ZPI8_9BACL|nr:glycosyltransferase [Alicyclobacillus fastidiosus]WAH43991.1 glycosyltransferase [Alicyclobacillus fastidiosus]
MHRVLLLTASFGAGHNQAAYAVQEALKERGASAEVVDYVSLLNPALRSFAKFSLIQGVQKAPGLYGLFYKSMSRIEPDSPLQRYVNHIGITRIQDYIDLFAPDVIASTFPTPMGVVGELRRHGIVQAPNVSIVTDYTAHRQWFHEYSDHYFVATDEVRRDLVRYGVDERRIDVFGIPLRRKFSADAVGFLRSHRQDLILQLGLSPDIPIVLLMGGGSGVLGDTSDWETFIQTSGLQYLIVCGQNRRLERRFAQLANDKVRVYGFTSEIDRLMAAADVIVTKPGGLTLTESMAIGLPMVLFKPIPGQEEINADYAVRAGVAVRAQHAEEAQAFLQKIMHQPHILQDMRRAAERVPVLGAAENIASRLIDLAGGTVTSPLQAFPSELQMT